MTGRQARSIHKTFVREFHTFTVSATDTYLILHFKKDLL